MNLKISLVFLLRPSGIPAGRTGSKPLSRGSAGAKARGFFLALLFLVTGCAGGGDKETVKAADKAGVNESRRVAEGFVRSLPGFKEYEGRNLTVIAEEPLRDSTGWVFDFRYTALVHGQPEKRYITVSVQGERASKVIPMPEGSRSP